MFRGRIYQFFKDIWIYVFSALFLGPFSALFLWPLEWGKAGYRDKDIILGEYNDLGQGNCTELMLKSKTNIINIYLWTKFPRTKILQWGKVIYVLYSTWQKFPKTWQKFPKTGQKCLGNICPGNICLVTLHTTVLRILSNIYKRIFVFVSNILKLYSVSDGYKTNVPRTKIPQTLLSNFGGFLSHFGEFLSGTI